MNKREAGQRHHLQRRIALCLALLLPACFVTDIIPTGGTKKKTSPPAPAEAPAPIPVPATPPTLSPRRLVRRLSLDLTRSLPALADVTQAAQDSNEVNRLIVRYLSLSNARLGIAKLHGKSLGLTNVHLPDLAHFVAEDDPSLAGTTLDSSFADKLYAEPLMRLRYLLDQKRPFGEAFAGSWSIVHRDIADLYGLAAEGVPWAGEPYVFTTYEDGRPPLGILSSNGLLAAYEGRAQIPPRTRTSSILMRLVCLRLEEGKAHLFYDLTSDELAQDLTALAPLRSPCRGCHAHWEDMASALSGVGTADNFAEWVSYQGSEVPVAGYWAGKRYDDAESLSAAIGHDPRLARCDYQGLLEGFYHRPSNARDTEALAAALDAYYKGTQDLMAGIEPLLRAVDYRLAPLIADVAQEYQRNASGLRLLRKDQWQGIMQSLIPEAESLSYPADLDPGSSEIAGHADAVPSAGYWNAANRLARQVATLIVDKELETGRLAVTRRVLRELPDGSGSSASEEQIKAQIKALWLQLTSEELVETEPPYADLMALWAASEPGDSMASFRRAWRTMLVGMFLHPNFIRY